jgi:hypothetical protein
MKAAVALVLVVAAFVALLPSLLLDGLSGLVLGTLLGHEDTELAPGCTDAAFARIRIGMTRDEVHRRLGPPLAAWEPPRREPLDPELAERWSTSPSGGNHRRRVVLYRDDRVVARRAGFWTSRAARRI